MPAGTKGALYLGVHCMDPVEPGYYKDNKVPEVDRMEWSLALGESGKKKNIRIRIGAGGEPTIYGAEVKVKHAAGVRNVALVRLPAQLFGKPKLERGYTLPLSSMLRTFARAYGIEWKADLKLAE
jgi:hypothetical protein